jgi:hypothetical protein
LELSYQSVIKKLTKSTDLQGSYPSPPTEHHPS